MKSGIYTGVLFIGPQTEYWKITMPCGTTVTYPLNGLPEVDTPCPCGNPNHWIVRYK